MHVFQNASQQQFFLLSQDCVFLSCCPYVISIDNRANGGFAGQELGSRYVSLVLNTFHCFAQI